jgi:hypothetical protein
MTTVRLRGKEFNTLTLSSARPVPRRDPPDPTTRMFDLSRWAGSTIRLRFAQVDNRGPLRAGIDDVRLERARP